MAKCEYQCPYFTDPFIKRSCPNASGLEPAKAIQACAEKVARKILAEPSLAEKLDIAAQQVHLRPGLGSGINIGGDARKMRKIGIPEESDLEL